jgi:hypothetical protein
LCRLGTFIAEVVAKFMKEPVDAWQALFLDCCFITDELAIMKSE